MFPVHAGRTRSLLPMFCCAALLAACGGSSVESVVPIVTAATASTDGANGVGSYGKKLLITVSGSSLDKGITLGSSGCSNMTLLTAAPYESNATTAYYECKVSSAGTVNVLVLRNSSGITLSTVPVSVPQPQVTITVGNGTASLGSFVITLSPAQAPITVANFLNYVETRFYEGVVFHRLSPNFVLQGGGYASGLDPDSTTTPTLKPANAAITLEDFRGLSNLQWTVAMARTGVADSATSQFFINLVDNTFLDGNLFNGTRGYAVFGNVSAGTDVITALTAQPCVSYTALLPAGDCLPLPNLVITAATRTR